MKWIFPPVPRTWLFCEVILSQLNLGIKRICQACGARYYDLNKQPITCPTCSTPFDPEAILKSRRARAVNDDKPSAGSPEVNSETDAEGNRNENIEEEAKDEIDSDDALLENDDAEADIEEEGVVPVIDESDSNN